MGPVRERLRLNEIAAPNLDGIDTGAPRHHLDDPLHRVGRFRTTGAAVRGDRRGVGDDVTEPRHYLGDLVATGSHPCGQHREAETGRVGIRPKVLRHDEAESLDGAVLGVADFHIVLLPSSVGHLQHRLAARLGELHRATRPLRQQRSKEQFRIPDDLGPETSAHIGSDHPAEVLGQVQPGGEIVAEVVRCLERGPHGEPARRPISQDCYRLDRDGRAALVGEAKAGAAVGFRQLTLGIVEHRHRGDGVGAVVGKQERRVRCGGGGDRRHEREGLVLHKHGGGCVGGEVAVLGDDDGHRFAGKADDIDGQCRPFELGQATGNVGIFGEIGCRPDAEHAGHGERRAHIDRKYARMRIRRSHERRECTACWRQVVDERAATG